MITLWKTKLPGENPELVESLERAMVRVVPKPPTAHWGMRGGFVKLRADATLALKLAGNDLTLEGYDDDLTREDIRSLLARIADALTASFPTLSSNDIAELRRLGKKPASSSTGVLSRVKIGPPPGSPESKASKIEPSDAAAHALTELVLELVSLARGLNTRLETLEARVEVLESRHDVEDTLTRAEQLAQALRRS